MANLLVMLSSLHTKIRRLESADKILLCQLTTRSYGL